MRAQARLADPSRRQHDGVKELVDHEVLYLRSSCDFREIGLRARYRPSPRFHQQLACVEQRWIILQREPRSHHGHRSFLWIEIENRIHTVGPCGPKPIADVVQFKMHETRIGIETSHYPWSNGIGRPNADNHLLVALANVGPTADRRSRHNVGTSCDRTCCRPEFKRTFIPLFIFSVTLEFVIHHSSHHLPQIIPRLPTPLPKSPYLTYNVCIVYLNVISLSLSWWGVGPVVRAVGVHVRNVRIRH
jgi:hypothetical protein